MNAARGPSAVERLVDAVRKRPLLFDTALALLVALLGVLEARSSRSIDVHQAVSIVALFLVAVPIVARRRYPLAAAIVTAVLATVAILVVNGVATAVAALVMAYSVIVYGPRWVGPVAAAVLAAGGMLPVLATILSGTAVRGVVAAIGAVVAVLVALCTWLAGALRRAQRRSVEQLRERARLLEQGRRQEVRLELLAERARISREVHDIVAHSLSGIVAQADGGQFAASRDPQRAVAVLGDIATAGRDALADIRGLLSMLRDHPDEPDETEAHPQPGADDVAVLVEQVRAGGLPVELAVFGTPRTLPTGTGLTVYRVAQEALTNVVKHAGRATPTRITLDWEGDELTLEVRDDGARGPRAELPHGGHGIAGMRERVALHGGSLTAGPRPDGGFVVRAALPYPPAS